MVSAAAFPAGFLTVTLLHPLQLQIIPEPDYTYRPTVKSGSL